MQKTSYEIAYKRLAQMAAAVTRPGGLPRGAVAGLYRLHVLMRDEEGRPALIVVSEYERRRDRAPTIEIEITLGHHLRFAVPTQRRHGGRLDVVQRGAHVNAALMAELGEYLADWLTAIHLKHRKFAEC